MAKEDGKKKNMTTSQIILLATKKRIAKYGYANVSMRDIAEEAGVALSQITYHYKNKDNLLIEVVRQIKYEYLTEIEANLKKCSTYKELISYVIDYCEGTIKNDTQTYRLLLDCFSMSLWSEACKEEFKLFFSDVSKVIAKYMKKNFILNDKIKEYSQEEIARFIECIVFGVAMQYITDESNNKIMHSFKIIQQVLN